MGSHQCSYSSTSCLHESTVEEEGFEVCTQCGFVMEAVMTGRLGHSHLDNVSPEWHVPSVNEAVLDILSFFHQDKQFMADQISRLYLETVRKKRPNQSESTKMGCLDMGLLAFFVWDVMMKNGCPHSPHEVAYFMRTSPLEMRRAEKKYFLTPTHALPYQYVNRFGAELSLPFPLIIGLETSIATLNSSLRKPECLIGAGILIMRDLLEKKVLDMEGKDVLFKSLLNGLKDAKLKQVLNVSVLAMKYARKDFKEGSEALEWIEKTVDNFMEKNTSVMMFKKVLQEKEESEMRQQQEGGGIEAAIGDTHHAISRK